MLMTVLKMSKNATTHHHHCPELRENTTNPSKNEKMISNIRKCNKNMANTTIGCPKLTKRGSYLGEKFEQARIKEFI